MLPGKFRAQLSAATMTSNVSRGSLRSQDLPVGLSSALPARTACSQGFLLTLSFAVRTVCDRHHRVGDFREYSGLNVLWLERAGLRAGLIYQRQVLAAGLIQLQLLLPAQRADASAISLQVCGGLVECLLRFVETLSNILKLVLEVIERLLRLRQFLAALFELARDLVPLVDQGDGLQRHQQSVW